MTQIGTRIHKHILWAVDPFEGERALLRSAAWAIQSLTRETTCIIEPIYLFSGYPVSILVETPQGLLEQIRKTGQELLEDSLRRIQLPTLQQLKVISKPYLPMRQAVHDLIDYAKRVGSDLIVVSTRARKGLKRWVLGSFAETLILHSSVPLFVVNPHWSRINYFKHILIPTDFSEESKKPFEKILELAQTLGSEITLFHKMRYELSPSVEIAFSAYPVYRDLLSKEMKAIESEAWKWIEKAKIKGLKASVEINSQLDQSIAESILTMTKKKQGIIAMATYSGPISSTLLGSITRKVVRRSPNPVWIIHPALDQETAQKKAA